MASDAQAAVTGRANWAPGREKFPKLFTGPREVSGETYECSDKEVVVYTRDGWRLVDTGMWTMSCERISFLEPAYMAHFLELYKRMIPMGWPGRARKMVEKAINTMDPRRTPAAQQVYRKNIEKCRGEGDGGLPNVIAIFATRCSIRAHVSGLTALRNRLRGFEMDFLLDLDTVQFNRRGTSVFTPNGQKLALEQPEVGGTKNRKATVVQGRMPPVYQEMEGKSLTVRQVDLTELEVVTEWADFRKCPDRIHMDVNEGIIYPPPITDRLGGLIGPAILLNHPYLERQKFATVAPINHPGISGRLGMQDGLHEEGGYQGPEEAGYQGPEEEVGHQGPALVGGKMDDGVKKAVKKAAKKAKKEAKRKAERKHERRIRKMEARMQKTHRVIKQAIAYIAQGNSQANTRDGVLAALRRCI